MAISVCRISLAWGNLFAERISRMPFWPLIIIKITVNCSGANFFISFKLKKKKKGFVSLSIHWTHYTIWVEVFDAHEDNLLKLYHNIYLHVIFSFSEKLPWLCNNSTQWSHFSSQNKNVFLHMKKPNTHDMTATWYIRITQCYFSMGIG